MYSKIINPDKHGKVVYQNKESALRLANYLNKEKGENATFYFNSKGDFDSKFMIEAIDNNVTGLSKNDDKFYALVIAPSKNELEHIDNDSEKFRTFTIACI